MSRTLDLSARRLAEARQREDADDTAEALALYAGKSSRGLTVSICSWLGTK